MADRLQLKVADETPMPGFFGPLRLSLKRGACDLSRVSSAAGVDLLVDHRGDQAVGVIKRASIRDRVLYATADTVETTRSAPYLEEVSGGLRRGVSPGFIIDEAEFQETDDGQIEMVISRFTPYEISLTSVPRNADAAIIAIDKDGGKAALSKTTARAGNSPPPSASTPERRPSMHASAPLPVSQSTSGTGTTKVAQTSRPSPASQIASEMVSGLSRELAAHQEDSRRWRAERLEELRMSEEQKTPEPRHVLAYALGYGPKPEGLLPEVVQGNIGQHATVALDLSGYGYKAAFDTSSAHGTVGTDGGAGLADLTARDSSARRILALPEMRSGLVRDQSVPVLETLPSSAMISEAAARIAVVDATFGTAPRLSPHTLMTVADYTATVGMLAPGFESMVLSAMMESSDRLLAEQLLEGDGMGANLTGIVNTTGVLTAEYAAASKGGHASFQDAEDMLDEDTPADRRAWVLSESLYRAARKTTRTPGDATYVVRNGRVLDDAPAIRSNLLADGVGIYGEWSGATVGTWSEAVVIADMVTTPGEIKLTLLRFVDVQIQRPARFVVLSEA